MRQTRAGGEGQRVGWTERYATPRGGGVEVRFRCERRFPERSRCTAEADLGGGEQVILDDPNPRRLAVRVGLLVPWLLETRRDWVGSCGTAGRDSEGVRAGSEGIPAGGRDERPPSQAAARLAAGREGPEGFFELGGERAAEPPAGGEDPPGEPSR